MCLRLLLLLAVLAPGLPLAGKPGDKDIARPDKAAGGVPAVKDQTVEVLRGQTVEITLQGVSSSTGSITFILRSQPKLGRFAEKAPVSKTKQSATLHYTAAADSKGDRDSFQFAAQVPGSSVCEPATVTVQIKDAAPKLDGPALVNAGRVVLGSGVARTFSLRNTGNAAWTAKVPAPKSWQWVQPPGGQFRLEPAAEITCELRCEPEAVGDLVESLAFHSSLQVQFSARVVPPFTVLPKVQTLAWKKDTQTRGGSVAIQNLDSTRALTVQVTAPAGLKAPASLAVEADKEAALAMVLEGDPAQPFSGTLKLSAGPYSQLVEVKAAPAPALLAWDAGETQKGGIHFGMLTDKTLPGAKHSLTLRNTGGGPAMAKLAVPAFFRLDPAPPADGVALAAGEAAAFTLFPPNDTVGTFGGELTATAGEARAAIPVSAGVDPSAIPPTPADFADWILNRLTRPVVATAPRTESQLRKIARANVHGLYISDGTEDAKLPRINEVTLEDDDGTNTSFSWELPPGDGWKFQLYRAGVERIKMEDGTPQMVKIWIPCGDEVQQSVDGRRARVKFTEMQAWVPFNFCIQTIAADGGKSFPGKPIRAYPKPPLPSHWRRYWEWYVAGGVVLFGAGYWLHKRWKQPISAIGV